MGFWLHLRQLLLKKIKKDEKDVEKKQGRFFFHKIVEKSKEASFSYEVFLPFSNF